MRSLLPRKSLDSLDHSSEPSVTELIRLLSADRRSGALTLQTPLGVGEVRFLDGAIVDALYRHLEGEKALFRLLGEREATFSFSTSDSSTLLHRIHTPTPALLVAAAHQAAEVSRLRETLDLQSHALLGLRDSTPEDPESLKALLDASGTPRTLPELLDQVPASDLEILHAIDLGLKSGVLRVIPLGSEKIPLADPERLSIFGALVARAARPEFRGPPRVCIAASSRRLLGVLTALARIQESQVPVSSVPSAPVPHLLATLKLGDGIELEVFGLPLVDAYAPLWGFVLPGCLSAALIETASLSAFEQACALGGVPILRSGPLLDGRDDCSAEEIASLIQKLLETSAQ